MNCKNLDKSIKCEINRIVNGLNNPPDFEAFSNTLACPYCYNQGFFLYVFETKIGRDEFYVCEDCHSAWVKSVNLETGTCRFINMEDTCPGRTHSSR